MDTTIAASHSDADARVSRDSPRRRLRHPRPADGRDCHRRRPQIPTSPPPTTPRSIEQITTTVVLGRNASHGACGAFGDRRTRHRDPAYRRVPRSIRASDRSQRRSAESPARRSPSADAPAPSAPSIGQHSAAAPVRRRRPDTAARTPPAQRLQCLRQTSDYACCAFRQRRRQRRRDCQAQDRGDDAAGRGTTTGVLPGASPIDRGARVVAPPNTKDAVSAMPPTPTCAARPAEPMVPPVTFNQIRLLVSGRRRAREREGMLQLGDGNVSIVAAGGSAPILSLATGSLSGLFYARFEAAQMARRQRTGTWRARSISGRMGFLRGERNWVILLTHGEPVILRIEDSALGPSCRHFRTHWARIQR